MTFKQIFISFLLIIVLPNFLVSQDTLKVDSIRKAILIDDDPVIAMLDSLASLKIFEDAEFPSTLQYQNWSNYSDTDIPFFPDSVYKERIAQMNDQSPFEYIYNGEVRKFIELYGARKRKLTARIMGLAQIYFPLFEEQLDKFNMPLELKYLAVIESALNPTANSPAGAKGLWQFMYGTGKVYGLKVSSYVDDRYDPYKATIAACEHLSDLYDIYGNWSLALAAYNSGAGNVNKAIRRSGGMKNFWAIHNYLPRETRSYVPAFIAASYVMTYANEHKIYPVDPGILYYEVDTVTVRQVLTFDQISEMLNIPIEEVDFLNPSFKHGVIPASPENTYKLRLRKKYIGNFVNNEATLYKYQTRKGIAQDQLNSLIAGSYRESDLYTVKSGETIGSIAKKFSMTTTELKSLNGLKKSVRPKQKILVYKKPAKKAEQGGSVSTYIPSSPARDTLKTEELANQEPVKKSAAQTEKPNTDAPKTTIHIVKSGESLGFIANKYNCSVDQLKQWNGLSKNTIIVGQKIKIARASSGTATTAKLQATGSKTTKPSASQAKYFYYTIVSGDNLWDIADKHDVTVSQLKSLNNLKNSSRLKPGQKIKIPK
jgi:membrane-bound lytic murein transglycosylase D